jgi:transposase InsO family protein
MLSYIGKLLGKLFLLFCTLLKNNCSRGPQPATCDVYVLQEEIKRLKTANRIMKQLIRRKRIKPSFMAKCKMILYVFRFNIPLRRIHLYLPVAKSTIRRYIIKAGTNIFSLMSQSSKSKSSPRKTALNIASLIWRIKDDNCSWGYLRIALHLWHLKVYLSPSSVRRILMRPRPTPGPSSTKKQKRKPLLTIAVNRPNALWSLDFPTFNLFGVFPVYVLGVIDHYSRKVFCLSSTFHPTAEWTVQELQKLFAAFSKPKSVLTDNGSAFVSHAFKKFTSSANIRHIKTAVRHPQTNGKIERFFQSLKYEFLSLFFITSKRRLNSLLYEYLHYYNRYRLHEAIDGQTPDSVHYNRRFTKPDKSFKLIRAPIEEIRMGSGHLRAYRLQKAA